MKGADFVHLHVHSHFSMLDGAMPIRTLIDGAKMHGMNALALTDHGNLFGALKFYKACLQKGVKPIVGYEAYVAPHSRLDRSRSRGIRDSSYHLTLLARNERGYKNLVKLASTAYLDGFYYKPRIDKDVLAEHADGLLCMSGCLKSEYCQSILKDDIHEAMRLAGLYQDIFGRENFFLEIMSHGITEQKKVFEDSIKIAQQVDAKLVATNDVHYLQREDARAHEVLLCINTGKTLNDPNRMRLSTQEFYMKSPEEMKILFKDLPDALLNTREVADRCNLEMNLSEKHFPKFPLAPGKTSMGYLRDLCESGLEKRFDPVAAEHRDRLAYELSVIEKTGFAGYFLIVWDFIRYAKENGIPVGPGRGSAVGSLVSYCLGITDIDPLRFDLIFERFLNPERISDPDIDIDFCMHRRDEVIDYVRRIYGEQNVAQIITFGRLAARAVIRDVGRVMDVPLDQVDSLAKRVPMVPNMTLEKALDQEPELKDLYDNDPQVRELLDMGKRLEGLCRNAGTHAAGVVIADKPLNEYVPLYCRGDDITTQFDMDGVAEIGLLKMDFLGLKTLTVIDMAVRTIKRTRGIDIAINRIPLDDKPTYAMLAKGFSKGVFQFESAGMRDLLQKMQSDCFEDLIACVALYRPGPLGNGMVDMYVRVKHGEEAPRYMHPMLEEILRETNGVILYQEQVMRIANQLAGFSMGESDTLRKAMGKKKPELMARYREKFVEGGVNNGIDQKTISDIYELIGNFAEYGFNKSHSAAYAFIAYQTAYLKENYFKEFMASLMTCDMGNREKLAEYMDECRRFDLEVLPPCVNESRAGFTVVDDNIRFGLHAVKGVGGKAVESIIVEKDENGNYRDFFDFCERVDLRQVNKAVIESLIKAGAFDSLGGHRSQYMAALDQALEMGSQAQKDRRKGQKTFFEEFQEAPQGDDAYVLALPAVPEWPENEMLKREKDVLGFFVTSHPLAKQAQIIARFSSTHTSGLKELENGEKVVLGGIVTMVRPRTIKNGRSQGMTMAIFELEDLHGTVNCVAFAEAYQKFGVHLQLDNMVFLMGSVDFRREDPSIKVDEIVPLREADEKLTASVSIRLQSAGLNEETLYSLRDICLAHPGPCPVFLEMHTPDHRVTRIKVGSTLFVAASKPFSDAVADLLGEGRMQYIPKLASV